MLPAHCRMENAIIKDMTRVERAEIFSRKKKDMNRSGWGGRRACYVTLDLRYDQEGERIEGRRK